MAVCVLAAAVPRGAEAQTDGCRFVEGGHGYLIVDDRGLRVRYDVQVSGPLWRSRPYGYHATGVLYCEACPHALRPGGLYHLNPAAGAADDPEIRRPATVADRLDRGQEIYGYPINLFAGDDLALQASRDDVRIGGLSGYAVLYRLNPDRLATYWKFAGLDDPGPAGLLVVSLTDGCVDLETSIMTSAADEMSDWALLIGLTQEVSITWTTPETEPLPAPKPEPDSVPEPPIGPPTYPLEDLLPPPT